MIDLTLMVYIVVLVLVGSVVFAIWFLTKEKREQPLPNETDLGSWLIPLPSGIEEGRLTTARRTFERNFETAITNAKDRVETENLQKVRDEVLKQHLFAFKGSSKYLLYSNRNLIDEKLSYPMGKDKRHLMSPQGIIDIGEEDGFHAVYLKMPDPDEVGIKPPERKALSELGDAIKYIRTAALNTERISEALKERDFYKGEAELSHDETAELRSKVERMARALAQKPLSGGEEPKVKGAFRSQLEEFLSGYRMLTSLGVGGLLYWIWPRNMWPHEPIFPAIIAGLVAFVVYPYIAKRL